MEQALMSAFIDDAGMLQACIILENSGKIAVVEDDQLSPELEAWVTAHNGLLLLAMEGKQGQYISLARLQAMRHQTASETVISNLLLLESQYLKLGFK